MAEEGRFRQIKTSNETGAEVTVIEEITEATAELQREDPTAMM